MKKIQTLLARLHRNNINLPGHTLINKSIQSFGNTEKLIFYVLAIILIASAILLVFRANQSFLVEIPRRGGIIIEGVTGTPRSINPITVNPFTSPEADNDLIALVYSGLLKAAPDGTLLPDLAKNYYVSEDSLVYTFILKSNLYWHDGKEITSDDVKFTIQKAQDPKIGSRHKASWDGVMVETPNNKTVIFTLNEPYSPFLQNTTIGILPKHLWENIHPENFAQYKLNTKPIGSGPYKIANIKKGGGKKVEYYDLVAFDKYALGKPYIDKIRIRFYANKNEIIEAYKKGGVTNIHSISPEEAKGLEETERIERAKLPRIFGAFFNQNESSIFTVRIVRDYINTAINKTEIINDVFYGFATAIDGPIPPGSLGCIPYENKISTTTISEIERAKKILEDGGWTANDEGILNKKTKEGTQLLAFSISTTQAPELASVAQKLKESWENVGAEVEIKFFETTNDLENHVIRPRKYDILLFGEIIGRDSDPFAFWHSSQRLDPGLNIASYTYIAVDKALERARATTSTEARLEQYKIFQEEIKNDIPAVFIYSPELIYMIGNDIKGLKLDVLNTPSERFLNVHEWFIKTEHVWKIFADEEEIL